MNKGGGGCTYPLFVVLVGAQCVDHEHEVNRHQHAHSDDSDRILPEPAAYEYMHVE